jgi:predicted secreted protein
MVLAILGGMILTPGDVISEKKDMTLTDRDNGKTVCLPVGQVLTLRLSGQSGTGYVWTIANSSGAS